MSIRPPISSLRSLTGIVSEVENIQLWSIAARHWQADVAFDAHVGHHAAIGGD
ncbi:hypothetical protein [Telmatospirillum sp.]|uniref:hypothetical protein n=1 Tax=Telmatospirillum sp. TaxID=2079197 RepID=UPI002844B9EB|nr:hypothetical protein [Telmatospirillum sp.]MDR3436585.1 hypothetical protein [Telmatospirillum sp.]